MSTLKQFHLYRLLKLTVLAVFIAFIMMPLNAAADSHEKIYIQIKEIRLLHVSENILDESDLESKWAMIVVHDDGLTTEVEYPGNTFIPAQNGDVIRPLLGYIEDIPEGKEEYTIYLTGIDIDDQSLEDFNDYGKPAFGEGIRSSIVAPSSISSIVGEVIDEGIDSIEWDKIALSFRQKVERSAPSFVRKFADYAPEAAASIFSFASSPLGGIVVGVAVDQGVDQAVDFFAQSDEIDSLLITLRHDEDWNVGTHTVTSYNESLEVVYEVGLVSSITLTIENNTSVHLCGLYVIPESDSGESSSFVDNTDNRLLDGPLAPGESSTFVLAAAGDYNVIADDCYGLIAADFVIPVSGQNRIPITNPSTKDYLEITNQTGEELCLLTVQDTKTDERPFDLLNYSKMSPQESLMIIFPYFSEDAILEFTAQNCKGDVVGGLVFLGEHLSTTTRISIVSSGEDATYLRAINATENEICDLDVTGEDANLMFSPLNNSFKSKVIASGQQHVINLPSGSYQIDIGFCDEDNDPQVYFVDIEDKSVRLVIEEP